MWESEMKRKIRSGKGTGQGTKTEAYCMENSGNVIDGLV